MKYNKLVRDKIPEIIKSKNQNPITHIASEEEYSKKLKEKLREEVDEFLKDSNTEELADILEVLHSLADSLNINMKELDSIRRAKSEKRGSFKLRIILDEVN